MNDVITKNQNKNFIPYNPAPVKGINIVKLNTCGTPLVCDEIVVNQGLATLFNVKHEVLINTTIPSLRCINLKRNPYGKIRGISTTNIINYSGSNIPQVSSYEQYDLRVINVKQILGIINIPEGKTNPNYIKWAYTEKEDAEIECNKQMEEINNQVIEINKEFIAGNNTFLSWASKKEDDAIAMKFNQEYVTAKGLYDIAKNKYFDLPFYKRWITKFDFTPPIDKNSCGSHARYQLREKLSRDELINKYQDVAIDYCRKNNIVFEN